MHEGFEAGQCIGLLLAVIGHVQDGDVAVFLSITLEKGADDRSGHAGKGHDIDDAARSPLGKIDRLSHGEDRLPFKGAVEVRLRFLEESGGLGFPKVPELPFEDLFEVVFILLLIVVGQKNLREVRKGLLPQAVSLWRPSLT